MILKELIAQVKTGTITNVQTRGNLEAYPGGKDVNDLMAPYVLVYDDFAVNTYYPTDNTIMPFVVEVHYPPGYITELNDYIEYELPALLNRKRFTDDEGYTFQVFVTAHVSILMEPNDDKSISGGNDDKTISKYRRVFVPRRGL